MIAVLFSVIAIFLLLVLSELLWNTKRLRGELGRKFVHILVGTFVAIWPFYMSFKSIQLISLAFLLVVLLSRRLSIFKAVHTVDRRTWGDVMFAIGIGLSSLLTTNKWVFMAAILHLSLADGLAALVGIRYGKDNQYKILGHTKSLVGTTTFTTISVLIVAFTLLAGTSSTNLLGFAILLPLGATILENIGVYGFDNILVPLLVVSVLNRL